MRASETTAREKPGRGSTVLWITATATIILIELYSLLPGGMTPLTSTVTYGLLDAWWGSALVMGFLAWLGFHFGIAKSGFGMGDVRALVAGMAAGIASWKWRTRAPDDSDPTQEATGAPWYLPWGEAKRYFESYWSERESARHLWHRYWHHLERPS